MSFIAALDAELKELHAKLTADPTFVKWNELQRVRRLYGAPESDELPAVPRTGRKWVTMPSTEPDESSPRGRKGDPERARAIEEAAKFIASFNGTPTPNADVLQHLIGLGITISGEKPLNNLSAMMSNSGLFTANGRRGWTMRTEHNIEGVGGEGETGNEADDFEPSPDDLRDLAIEREADEQAAFGRISDVS